MEGVYYFMEFWENKSLQNLSTIIDGIEYIEEWKCVVGFNGEYQVSTFGRVKTMPRLLYTGRNQKLVKIQKEKILSAYLVNTGYRCVRLSVNKTKKHLNIHRVVAAAFVGNPYNYPHVNHIDGNKTNNFWLNLEWCTPKHNSKHALSIGLSSISKTFYEQRNNPSFKVMKPVIDVNTGVKYRSISTAAKALHITRENIRKIIRDNNRSNINLKYG